MPSRIVHDVINHLLETSEVHFEEPPIERVGFGGQGGFQQMYMGSFNAQRPTLRRHVRHSELYDLPVEIYHELLETLHGMSRGRQGENISRRFRDVRVERLELMPSPTSFENDIRIEFSVGDLDEDHWMRGERRSAQINPIINPDGVEIWGQKVLNRPKKKKVEKHFEDDLFKL